MSILRFDFRLSLRGAKRRSNPVARDCFAPLAMTLIGTAMIFYEMGLTKGEIINRLHVNKTVLLRWLQGETFPAKSHIERIVSLAKDILNLDLDPLTLSVVKEPSEWKEIGEGDLALPRKAQKTIIGKLSQPGNMQKKDIVLLKNSP